MAAPVGGVLSGLASKFASAASGWNGKIWFLKGGINGCGDMEMSEGSSGEEEEGDTEMESETKPLNLTDVDMDGTSGPSGWNSPTTSSARLCGSKGSAASSETAKSSGRSRDGNGASSSPSTRMVGGLGKLAFQQGDLRPFLLLVIIGHY